MPVIPAYTIVLEKHVRGVFAGLHSPTMGQSSAQDGLGTDLLDYVNRSAGMSRNYEEMRNYIIENMPEDQVAAFHEQMSESAARAINMGHLLGLRELMLNWAATAEIHAIPGEAEKIAEAMAEAESTRAQRMAEGPWDWKGELVKLMEGG